MKEELRLQHLKEEEEALAAFKIKEKEAKEEARAFFAAFDDRDPDVRRADLFYTDLYPFFFFLSQEKESDI